VPDLHLSDNLSKYNGLRYQILEIDLRKVLARTLAGKYDPKIAKVRLVKIDQTPQFAYLHGDRERYLKYLQTYQQHVEYGTKHSPQAFDALIQTFGHYLNNEHVSDFLVLKKQWTLFGRKYCIIDGLHRASIMLQRGTFVVPVAVFE